MSWVGLTFGTHIERSAWPELRPENRGMDSKWDLYLYLGIYLIAIFLGHYDSKKSSQNFFGKIFFRRIFSIEKFLTQSRYNAIIALLVYK